MSVVVEIDSNNSRIVRRIQSRKDAFVCLSMRIVSLYAGMSTCWWKYSGGGSGFVAPAAVLILNAVRAGLGLLSRKGVPALELPRWKSARVIRQAASGRLGATDATAA